MHVQSFFRRLVDRSVDREPSAASLRVVPRSQKLMQFVSRKALAFGGSVLLAFGPPAAWSAVYSTQVILETAQEAPWRGGLPRTALRGTLQVGGRLDEKIGRIVRDPLFGSRYGAELSVDLFGNVQFDTDFDIAPDSHTQLRIPVDFSLSLPDTVGAGQHIKLQLDSFSSGVGAQTDSAFGLAFEKSAIRAAFNADVAARACFGGCAQYGQNDIDLNVGVRTDIAEVVEEVGSIKRVRLFTNPAELNLFENGEDYLFKLPPGVPGNLPDPNSKIIIDNQTLTTTSTTELNPFSGGATFDSTGSVDELVTYSFDIDNTFLSALGPAWAPYLAGGTVDLGPWDISYDLLGASLDLSLGASMSTSWNLPSATDPFAYFVTLDFSKPVTVPGGGTVTRLEGRLSDIPTFIHPGGYLEVVPTIRHQFDAFMEHELNVTADGSLSLQLLQFTVDADGGGLSFGTLSVGPVFRDSLTFASGTISSTRFIGSSGGFMPASGQAIVLAPAATASAPATAFTCLLGLGVLGLTSVRNGRRSMTG